MDEEDGNDRYRRQLRPEHRGIVARHRLKHAGHAQSVGRVRMPHDDFVDPQAQGVGCAGGGKFPLLAHSVPQFGIDDDPGPEVAHHGGEKDEVRDREAAIERQQERSRLRIAENAAENEQGHSAGPKATSTAV